MKQIGTLAFTGRSIQAVIDRHGTDKREGEQVGAYPLDVGPMTAAQIFEQSRGASLALIYQRLFRGKRNLAELVAPPTAKSEMTMAKKAAMEMKARRRNAALILRDERRAYLDAQRNGHKQL